MLLHQKTCTDFKTCTSLYHWPVVNAWMFPLAKSQYW